MKKLIFLIIFCVLASSAFSQIPDRPTQPVGDENVCINDTDVFQSVYTTTSNATTFDWLIVPDTAGVFINSDGVTATIQWNNNFFGMTRIYARAINGTDTSQYSQEKFTKIHKKPKDMYIIGPKLAQKGWMNSIYESRGNDVDMCDWSWDIEPETNGFFPNSPTCNVYGVYFPNDTGTFVITAIARSYCGDTSVNYVFSVIDPVIVNQSIPQLQDSIVTFEIVVDSLIVETDSLIIETDSLIVENIIVETLTDSLIVENIIVETLTDSLIVENIVVETLTDSLIVVTDSIQTQVDTLSVYYMVDMEEGTDTLFNTEVGTFTLSLAPDNPGQIDISSTEQMLWIEFYDEQSNKIKEIVVNNKNVSIRITRIEMPLGTYTIHIKTGRGKGIYRIDLK